MGKKSEERQRNTIVSVRLDGREEAILDARATERGLSRSDYTRAILVSETPIGVTFRRRISGTEVQVAALADQVSHLLAELGKIGSNINQLAHTSNSFHARDLPCVTPAGEITSLIAAIEPIRESAIEIRAAALLALRVNRSSEG